jgi:hypothetical protein
MMDHVQLYINGALVYEQQASGGTTPPPDGGGGTPTPVPPSFTFVFEQRGQVLINDLKMGEQYVYAQPVPAGYAGLMGHVLVPQTGGLTPDYLRDVECWESWEPGGVAIAGTHYRGAVSMGMGFPMPTFSVTAAPSARTCYFTLMLLTDDARLGVQQQHA